MSTSNHDVSRYRAALDGAMEKLKAALRSLAVMAFGRRVSHLTRPQVADALVSEAELAMARKRPIAVCCQCQKVRDDRGRWVRPRPAPTSSERLTHGYCPQCAAACLAELEAEAALFRPAAGHRPMVRRVRPVTGCL